MCLLVTTDQHPASDTAVTTKRCSICVPHGATWLGGTPTHPATFGRMSDPQNWSAIRAGGSHWPGGPHVFSWCRRAAGMMVARRATYARAVFDRWGSPIRGYPEPISNYAAIAVATRRDVAGTGVNVWCRFAATWIRRWFLRLPVRGAAAISCGRPARLAQKH